jgi:hypothetical protein
LQEAIADRGGGESPGGGERCALVESEPAARKIGRVEDLTHGKRQPCRADKRGDGADNARLRDDAATARRIGRRRKAERRRQIIEDQHVDDRKTADRFRIRSEHRIGEQQRIEECHCCGDAEQRRLRKTPYG